MKDYSTDKFSSAGSIEMIGLLEFAQRMRVCANTIRNWIEDGRLTAGEHYLHVGRVYRFPWSLEFVEKLLKCVTPKPAPQRPKLKSRTANRAHIHYRA